MTCATCRFAVLKAWDYGDDDDHDDRAWMECRRYPPVLYVQRGSLRQQWPTAFEPCGEWTAADHTLPPAAHVERPNPTRVIVETGGRISQALVARWRARR